MQISKAQLTVFMIRAGINSSKELAAAAGVSANTISRLLNGGTATVPTIGKLAEALNCDPGEIIQAKGA